MLTRLPLALFLSVIGPALAAAQTYYLSPAGNDTNPCTQIAPCREMQRVIALGLDPGDAVLFADGQYQRFTLKDVSGRADAPIILRAQGPGVEILRTSSLSIDQSNQDNILITNCRYIELDGFTSFNAPRAALTISRGDHITVRNSTFGNNAVWGIFTGGGADDLLIENNKCFGAKEQHGIYISNGTKNTIVRGNELYGNPRCGLQFNGAQVTNARVENNLIYDNKGAGLNLMGLQDSVILNNVLFRNGGGVSLIRGSGISADIPNLVSNVRILNNTINGTVHLGSWTGGGAHVVKNNLISSNFIGMTLDTGLIAENTISDNNLFIQPLSYEVQVGGSNFTLAQWQQLPYGQDANSFEAPLADLYVDSANDDYHLAAVSPALDRGQTLVEVPVDFDAKSRPYGLSSDIGAYEFTGQIQQQAPRITSQPSSQTVDEAQAVTFRIVAAGSLPLRYQWRRNGVNISGATSASYSFTAALADNGARFACYVSNDYPPAALSDSALLTVRDEPPPPSPPPPSPSPSPPPSPVQAFPNPWRADHHAAGAITLARLAAGTTVKLFTISGQWIRTLTADSSGNASWDLKTSSGEQAASGLYIYLATDQEGHKARGKLVIIR